MEKYQTFMPRVGALIIDSLVFVPLTIINYPISGLELPPAVFYLWLLTMNLAHPFYTVLMHGYYGQTLGKMVLKVKVVDLQENPITFNQAVIRSLPWIIFSSSVVFIAMSQTGADDNISFFSMSFITIIVTVSSIIWKIADIAVFILNEKNCALHDFIAGTVVVKLNP
jgi:uncharacterized RDD family membrane protein YckC